MKQLAASLGIALPDAPDFVSVSAASIIIVATLAAGWAAGKWVGPRISDFLERKAGERGEALVPRICAILRYLIVWLVLMLVMRVDTWPPISALLLGLFAASAAGLVVRQAARALQLPRWASWLLAAFLFVAILADAVGGLKPVTTTLDQIAFTIGSRRLSLLILIQMLVALVALYALVRLANGLVEFSIKHATGLDPTQRLLTQKLAAIVIIAIAFFVAIDLTGIDLTALAVFSGALGLAVGFGLQKTVGNLIAGIILLLDRSIKPGDVISVGETFGSVSRIGVRAVSIVTRDGKEYLIPNEILMTEEVVNWSYSTRDVRISIPIGIAYGCDVDLAHQLMVEAASASPRVLKTPRPAVWITALGENAINHEIRVWIADPEAGLGSVRSEILHRLLQLFVENDISVPFPQRDIRIREWPGSGDRPSGAGKPDRPTGRSKP